MARAHAELGRFDEARRHMAEALVATWRGFGAIEASAPKPVNCLWACMIGLARASKRLICSGQRRCSMSSADSMVYAGIFHVLHAAD
jgi:hypothetical protein